MNPAYASSLAPQTRRFAVVFLDYENIFYYFKNDFFDPPNLNDHILELLRNLKRKLAQDYDLDCIAINAYADFERLETTPQGALYLLGVDTKNVMGTDHKNAADMRLCIDVLEMLYTRPEIGTFVLVGGDRDYIPVIQHLRRQAREVLGVGFRDSVSGDLLMNLGEAQFIDGSELLDPQMMESMVSRRTERLQLREERERRYQEQASNYEERSRALLSTQNTHTVEAPVQSDEETPTQHLEPPLPFAPPREIVDANEKECLRLILEKLSRLIHTKDLWLGPFMRQITDEMPSLADFERRRCVDALVRSGAIRIEKRQGDRFPFSVVVVNEAHPQVAEIQAVLRSFEDELGEQIQPVEGAETTGEESPSAENTAVENAPSKEGISSEPEAGAAPASLEEAILQEEG